MGSALGTVTELRTVHLAGQGKLEPIIDRVLPLHRAGEAHLLLENRKILERFAFVQPFKGSLDFFNGEHVTLRLRRDHLSLVSVLLPSF